MMARDYKKEYALRKDKGAYSTLSTQLSKTIADDFRAKCSLDEVTPNAFFKACVDAYLDNTLVYENGKLRMN